jgi:hypothetical protein
VSGAFSGLKTGPKGKGHRDDEDPGSMVTIPDDALSNRVAEGELVVAHENLAR